MATDSRIRRALLRPLSHRRKTAADRHRIIEAVAHLDTRAFGEHVLPETLAVARRKRGADSWKDSANAGRFVALAQALYAARRVSRQEYVLFASFPVEEVHEARWIDGQYERDLGDISRQMDELEREYGLASDEYWPRDQAPRAYQRLSDEYSACLEIEFVRALRDFGLNDLADLKESHPEEFDRLRERGRRSVFHRDEIVAVLKDIIVQYEAEARRAASAKAYSAAITLLGAGLEGLLLLRCLKSKRRALLVSKKLPRKLRPPESDDPTKWRFETLIETCRAAGWLPPVVTSVAQYDSAGLAHSLRSMRNFVHPARRARERPWSEADEGDYRDAEAIYVVLMSKMAGRLDNLNEPST